MAVQVWPGWLTVQITLYSDSVDAMHTTLDITTPLALTIPLHLIISGAPY